MKKIEEARQVQVDEKIRTIYEAEKKLSQICRDGESDKERYRQIQSRTK